MNVKMTKQLMALILSLNAVYAIADAVLKDGPCPIGYQSQGGYCTNERPSSAAPVSKDGACPIGYQSQGNYCAPTPGAPQAVTKTGPCPIGYLTQGGYCVSN